MLVATHHSLYVTSFWNVAILHKQEIIASMLITWKELFQDIYIDIIMTFLRQINLFNKIQLLFLKSCFVLHLYQTIITIF